jgi:hypothetical protein
MIVLLSRQVLHLHLLNGLLILVVALHVPFLLANIIFIMLQSILLETGQVARMCTSIEPLYSCLIETTWASKVLVNWNDHTFVDKMGLNDLVYNT